MKAAIKIIFAALTAVLFAAAAWSVLAGALNTPMFEPNEAHGFLLDTVGAAIIAFIAAQLGITVGGGGSFRAAVNKAMGESEWGLALLAIDAGVFLIAGLGFVLLWVKPDLIAVAPGAAELAEAPEYIGAQAKAFVGVTLAALAGLAPSAS